MRLRFSCIYYYFLNNPLEVLLVLLVRNFIRNGVSREANLFSILTWNLINDMKFIKVK